jgi:hypothetical protein
MILLFVNQAQRGQYSCGSFVLMAYGSGDAKSLEP